MMKKIFILIIGILIISSCGANVKTVSGNQKIILPKKNELTETEMKIWHHLDLEKDTIPGMSVAKAYEFLKEKTGKKVLVAVLDSGQDIHHEDLKSVVYTNKGEIANNDIDDDNNGYTDDMNGWNFLGGETGNLYAEQLEITRMVKKMRSKFLGKTYLEIPEEEKEAFNDYVEYNIIYTEKVVENELLKERVNQIYTIMKEIGDSLGKLDFTIEDLEAIQPTDLYFMTKVNNMKMLFEYGVKTKDIIMYKSTLTSNKHYDLEFVSRTIIGDNPEDISDTNYGNNNVLHTVAEESHGTHVAGIISANRINKIGVKGIADNVEILPIRTVPDGDEWDKDIALAIRYAVDNGAKIINTSFGKAYSPHKEWVFDAIKYAAKNDVLIINAAGNDGKNMDSIKSFPNDSEDLENEFSDNFITIGAIGYNYNEKLIANFSNYGKKNVDIFAPGDNIYSTYPNDKYEFASGTSMASPAVAGVAAIIRSYYPELSASEVKKIILNSGTKINFEVIRPNSENTKVSLSDLCVSGRIVNANNAVRMAAKISKK